jgi:flagellar export protein FliJ
MKKFVFSLEKVLGFKQQTLGIKKNEMAILQAKLHELEVEIQNLENQFSALNAKMVEETKHGISQSDIAIYKMYFNTLNEKIQKLIENKLQLLEQISKKKAEILQVNTEISGLEKLRDKQLSDYMKAAQKSQELAIEEFVSQAHSSAG